MPKKFPHRQIIAAARKLEDPAARAELLARGTRELDEPYRLAQPLWEALLEIEGLSRAQAARRIGALALEVDEIKLLAAVGELLDDHYEEDEAVRVLRRMYERGGRDSDSICTLGTLLTLRHDEEGARVLQEGIEASPWWPRPRIALAMHQLRRDPESALALLAPCLDDPDHDDEPFLHEAAAVVLERLGRAAASEAELRRAVHSHNGSRAAALACFAAWNHREQRHERALRHARTLLELKIARADREEVEPVIVEAFTTAGLTREILPWVLERCREGPPSHLASEIFSALRSLHPPDFPRLEAAAATMRRQFEEAGDDPTCWVVELARLAAEQGDEASLRRLGEELADPGNLVLVGFAWLNLRRASESAAYAERALRIEPHHFNAHLLRCEAALMVGDGAGARQHALRAHELNPAEHGPWEDLALLDTRAGRLAEADSNSARALELDPSCPTAWLARAESLLALGDEPGAERHLERALHLGELSDHDDRAPLKAAMAGEAEELERLLSAGMEAFPTWAGRLRALASTRSSPCPIPY